MKTAYIYTLSDPRTNEVRYVGKTINPEQRRNAHGVLKREVKSRKKNWVKQLKKLGLKPVFEIVDEVDESEWKFWEKYWIGQFRNWGFRLVNHTSGGEGAVCGNATSFKKGENRKEVVEIDTDGNVLMLYSSVTSTGSSSVIDKKGRMTSRGSIMLYKSTYDKMSHIDLIQYISEGLQIRVKNENERIYKSVKNGGFKNGFTPWNKGKRYRASAKPVHQYNATTGVFIKTWADCIEASEYYKTDSDNLRNCARGVSKSAVGYVWSYEKKDKVEPVKYKSRTNNKTKSKLINNEK